MKKHYMALAAFALPLLASAQTVKVDFEDATSYKAVGVYDSWEESPFRTGKLKGNAAVVDNFLNQENEEGIVPNPSAKIAGVQRSRFGSNMFGLRVDLNTPFDITPTQKYVHVMIYKPVEGNVMLMGLGKRTDRTKQSPEVEQFWVKSTSTVTAGKWCEAVFPVKGNAGVQIYSLVVVPDCASPHNLTEDFVAYIDNIEVNSKATPSLVTSYYALNYPPETAQTRDDRYMTEVRITSPSDKTQRISVPQKTLRKLYLDLTDKSLKAKAGEIISPAVSWTGNAMHAYAYVDYGQDGSFNCDLNEDGTPATGSDVASYSYCKGKNSAGKTISNSNTLSMPTFTLPKDLKPGFYRMRYKVDWDDIDAGGSTVQNIANNGGTIVDTRLNIHEDEVNISAASRNGFITKEDGTTQLVGTKTKFGEEFKIKATPAAGFKLGYIAISHGYNLEGEVYNKYGTRQYTCDTIKASKFAEDGTYTIPASMIDGEVSIEGQFVSESTPGEDDYDAFYTINFDKDEKQPRADNSLGSGYRYTNNVTFTTASGGEQSIEANQQTNLKLFVDKSNSTAILAKAGDELSATSDFNGSWMHSYIYVDFGKDGQFSFDINSDGTPADGSDLFSYSCYSKKNSNGETADEGTAFNAPAKAIPANTAPGFYRVRYKIDWDNLDAGGSTVSDNLITNNGGIIFDTRLNVHADEVSVKAAGGKGGAVTTADGKALDGTKVAFGEKLTFKAVPENGYKLVSATVKHGYNLGGKERDEYGTRQYSVLSLTAADFTDNAYTLPATSVDGDVEIVCKFEDPTGIDALGNVAGLTFRGETGKLLLNAAEPAGVKVTDVAGRTIFCGNVNGSRSLTLPAGVYTVNGKKVAVK